MGLKIEATITDSDFKKKIAEIQKQLSATGKISKENGDAIDKAYREAFRSSARESMELSQSFNLQRKYVKDLESELRRLQIEARTAKNYTTQTELNKKINELTKTVNDERKALEYLDEQQRKVAMSTKELKLEQGELHESFEKTKESSESLKGAFAKIGGIYALKQLGSAIIETRSRFQMMETSIQTMLGNKEKADKLLQEAKEYAAISPLTIGDMNSAIEMMIGFGIQADKVMGYLRALGDISRGDSQRFNSLTLAFSQMSAAGKLMGQDLNQMINAGFNPLSVMAEKTGKSIGQLKEAMSKGTISAQDIQQAFLDATSAGGKFYQMSEKGSKTINGQISMLQDTIDNIFNTIGQKSEGVIMGGIAAIRKLIENYETLGRILASLVATYGIYRTAVMVNTAVELGSVSAIMAKVKATKAAAAAQALLNSVMKLNPYVAVIAGITALASSMAILVKRTDSLKKAQEEIASKLKEINELSDERKAKSQELLSVLQSETATELAKVKAYDELQKMYPGLLGSYDKEAEKLKNTGDLLKIINAEEEKRIYNEKISERNRLRQNVGLRQESMASNIFVAGGSFSSPYQNYKIQADQMTKDQQKLTALESELLKDRLAKYKADLVNYSAEKLNAELAVMKAMQKVNGEYDLGDGIKAKGSDLSAMIENISSEIDRRGKKSTLKDDYERAKKEWEEAKKALAAIDKDKDKFTKEQRAKAVAREKETKAAYEALGGQTSEKVSQRYDNNATAEINAINSSNKLISRAITDGEIAKTEEANKAIVDGMERRRRTIELEYRKEQIQAERQYEDAVEAEKKRQEDKYKNSNNGSLKGFQFDDSNAIMENAVTQRELALQRAEQRREEANKQWQKDEAQAMSDYLIQWGTYEERKAEIVKKYSKLIAEAETEGQRAILSKQQAKDERTLDETFSQTYRSIYRDAGKLTKKELENTFNLANAELEKLIQEGGSANQEKIQKLQKQLENISKEYTNIRDVDFGANLGDLGAKIFNIKTLEEWKKKLDEAKESTGDVDKELARAKEDLKAIAKGAALNTFVSGLNLAADCMGRIAEETGDEKLGTAAQVLGDIGDTMNSVLEGAKSGGLIGAAIAGISSIVEKIAQAFTSAYIAEQKLRKEAEAYRKEIQLINLEVGDNSSIFGTQEIAKGAEAWKKATEAIDAYRQEYENLGSTRVNQTNYSWIARVFGKKDKYASLSSIAPGMFNSDGTINIEAAQAFLDTHEEINDQLRKEIESAIELQQAYEEAQKTLDEVASSFVGSLAGDLADAVWDGIVLGGEDAWSKWEEISADAISSIGKQMLSEMILQNYLDTYQQKVRDAFGEGDNASDALLAVTNEIIQGLPAVFEDMTEVAQQYKDQFEALGYNFESSSRSGATKNVVQASQESVDKQSGILTSIQGFTYTIDAKMDELVRNGQNQAIYRNQITALITDIKSDTARLHAIENGVANVYGMVESIALRGVKLQG